MAQSQSSELCRLTWNPASRYADQPVWDLELFDASEVMISIVYVSLHCWIGENWVLETQVCSLKNSLSSVHSVCTSIVGEDSLIAPQTCQNSDIMLLKIVLMGLPGLQQRDQRKQCEHLWGDTQPWNPWLQRTLPSSPGLSPPLSPGRPVLTPRVTDCQFPEGKPSQQQPPPQIRNVCVLLDIDYHF